MWDESHPFQASLVIMRHMIDPQAHWIAPHEPSIVGLQQFGSRTHALIHLFER